MVLFKPDISRLLDISCEFLFVSAFYEPNIAILDLSSFDCYFKAHFITRPVFPLSLLQESMLQTSVVHLYVNSFIDFPVKAIVFSSSIRIFSCITPEVESLLIKVLSVKLNRSIAIVSVHATSSQGLCAKAKFSYAIA